jgi:pseudouridine synthase
MERLQKYLAGLGIASRRKCEELIAQGLVKVNGNIVTELGTKIDPELDKVEVNEQEVRKMKQDFVYIMLNKPTGYITSLKQEDSSSPLVTDLIKGMGRLFPVGRLDKDSSGLLLMTDDGEFAFKLTHPSYLKEKEYEVETLEPITKGVVYKLIEGVRIDGRLTAKAKVKILSEYKLSITIIEGRNRQIRKMLQKVGNKVVNLKRIRIKNLLLGDLKIGAYRHLNKEEVQDLML